MKLAILFLLCSQAHSVEQSLASADQAVANGSVGTAVGIYANILEQSEDNPVFGREGAKSVAVRKLAELPACDIEASYGAKARYRLRAAAGIEDLRAVCARYPLCEAGRDARFVLAYHHWDRGAFDVARRLEPRYPWFPLVLPIAKPGSYTLALRPDQIDGYGEVCLQEHIGGKLVWNQPLCHIDDRSTLETFHARGGFVVCIPMRGRIFCLDAIERRIAWIADYEYVNGGAGAPSWFAEIGLTLILPHDGRSILVAMPEGGQVLGNIHVGRTSEIVRKYTAWRKP